MNILIQDLLEYAKSGNKEVAFEKVNLNQTFREVTGLLASVTEEKNAVTTISNLQSVWAQPTGMKLLFQNLLGDALKYQSNQSQPFINIGAEETERAIIISVEDNGIGISPAYQNKIFKRFSRLHHSSEYSGIEMGLARSKIIADIHKVKIELTSTLGEGTFYFTIAKTKKNK